MTVEVYAKCAALSDDLQPEGWARVATEWPWHRPIFPGLGDPSIVGAGAFHYRVRHGNGWDHSALATRTNRSPREQPCMFQRESVEQTFWVSEDMDPADLMKRKIEARALGH